MLCNPAASARSRNHSFFRLGQASFSQVFWLRRITNWCRTIITSSVLLALAYFLAVGIQGYWSALLTLAAVGAASGLVYGICMTLIGDSSHPSRGFGGAQLAQAAVAIPLVAIIPALVIPQFGSSGLMLTLAGTGVLCLVVSPLIPPEGLRQIDPALEEQLGLQENEHNPGKQRALNLGSLSAVAACVFYLNGHTGLWVFVERIGHNAGLEKDFIGYMLAAAGVTGLISALIPMALGDRFGRVAVPAIGTLLFVLGGVLLLDSGSYSYAAGCVVVSVVYAATAPYFFAQVASADKEGKIITWLPAVNMTAGGIGPLLSGWIYDGGYRSVIVFCAGSVVLSLGFQTISSLSAKRATSTN